MQKYIKLIYNIFIYENEKYRINNNRNKRIK